MTPAERFRLYVVVTPGGHWRWCGPTIGKSPDYGRIFLGNDQTPRQMLAHRFSFALHNGPIPDGFVVDHLCRWTLCVNPLHLDAVTQAVNIERGTRH